MSFDEQGIQQTPEPLFDDSKTSLLKIDMPIGKMKFFVNSIIIFVLQLVAMIIYYLFYFTMKSPSSILALIIVTGILFGMPILYLNFVNYTKRMYDITGNFHRGIWFTVGLFAISSFCIFLFPPAILFFYIAMIFMPGELVKNERKN